MTTVSAPPTGLAAADELLAMFFPLLPRARPSCHPLDARIGHVEDVVQQAQELPADMLLRAAEALNFSALIASDCGMPDLARHLCQRQHTAIRATGPVGLAHAKLTLQPLINLSRLHTRAGDGATAYQVLDALFTAVQARSTTNIDGIDVDAGNLVNDASHAELVQWLWSVLLADGTRALARAGRWDDARQQAAQHHGVGTRLLDGRQVAIIATHPQAALVMLAATDTPTPWERAVAACLTTVCTIRGRQGTEADVAAMIDAYHATGSDTIDPVFRARLGLTVTALAANHPDAAAIAEQAAENTIDAYIARDILASAHLIPLTDNTVHGLNETVRQAGLGAGTIPAALLDRLLHTTDTAERLISTATRTRT